MTPSRSASFGRLSGKSVVFRATPERGSRSGAGGHSVVERDHERIFAEHRNGPAHSLPLAERVGRYDDFAAQIPDREVMRVVTEIQNDEEATRSILANECEEITGRRDRDVFAQLERGFSPTELNQASIQVQRRPVILPFDLHVASFGIEPNRKPRLDGAEAGAGLS